MHKNIIKLKIQHEKAFKALEELQQVLLEIEQEVGPLDNMRIHDMGASMKLKVSNRIIRLAEFTV
jgi:hypothetical protein